MNPLVIKHTRPSFLSPLIFMSHCALDSILVGACCHSYFTHGCSHILPIMALLWAFAAWCGCCGRKSSKSQYNIMMEKQYTWGANEPADTILLYLHLSSSDTLCVFTASSLLWKCEVGVGEMAVRQGCVHTLSFICEKHLKHHIFIYLHHVGPHSMIHGGLVYSCKNSNCRFWLHNLFNSSLYSLWNIAQHQMGK